MNQMGAARCTVLFACALAAAGCRTPDTGAPAPAPAPYVPVSPALPPIPAVEAPLALSVIHPTPGTPLPRVDSTFVYGSAGTGGVALRINGETVPVAPNGAFLAYLPLPADGAWRLEAWKGAQHDTLTRAYRRPASPASPSPSTGTPGATGDGVLPVPRAAVVTKPGDTLQTGSEAAYGSPTPGGDYRWFFPRGTRLTVVERRGTRVRVALDGANRAWLDAADVSLGDTVSAARLGERRAVRITLDGAAAHPRIRVSGAERAPFLVDVEEGGRALALTVHGAREAAPARTAAADAWVGAPSTVADGAGSLRVRVPLASPLWGWRAFFEGGDLVVEVRRPPRIDAAAPLRGIRVMIDPGHPPAGATGPTGLYEGDANLAIALPLAEILRARGADVRLTRTTRDTLELRPRVDAAVRADAHVLVSVHNNAFGEGQDPFRTHHTATYYFHPFAQPLARALNTELAAVTGIRDAGAVRGNLALARPTWMPSALTESLFMPIPEQEAALRDPAFARRLAEAHARGLEAFLRAAASSSPPSSATP